MAIVWVMPRASVTSILYLDEADWPLASQVASHRDLRRGLSNLFNLSASDAEPLFGKNKPCD